MIFVAVKIQVSVFLQEIIITKRAKIEDGFVLGVI